MRYEVAEETYFNHTTRDNRTPEVGLSRVIADVPFG